MIKESIEAAKIASQALKDKKIICFATETVYALACNASSDSAVRKLYKIKKRSPEKPISIFVKNLQKAECFLNFSNLENKIAQNFMPGMITLILQRKNTSNKKTFISSFLNRNDNSLGLRIPNHQFCLELLKNFNGIIATTSANLSNEDPIIDSEQAKIYFKNKIDLIIDGGICQYKIPSTILKVIDNKIMIIREGLIKQNQIDSLYEKNN